MAHAQGKVPAIIIDETADGGRQVVLRPENNDLFIRTGQQVIAACSLGISVELWMQEMQSMYEFVANWSKDRKDLIHSCYSLPQNSGMVLFFVVKADEFDFQLAGQLVDLNTHLITEFNIGMIEVQQIPHREMDRFINQETAKRIYGSSVESHQAVDA
jgi:hypothetical protein